MPKALENGMKIIFKHANEVLRKEGYNQFSMRKVASAAGIAASTIYNYFPTKKYLMISLMEDFWENFHVKYDQIIINDKIDMYEKLRIMFTELKEFIHTFQSVWVDSEIQKETNVEYEKRNEAIEKLIVDIDLLLSMEFKNKNFIEEISRRNIAEFIISNFMAIIIAEQMEYEVFEKILKEILKKNN